MLQCSTCARRTRPSMGREFQRPSSFQPSIRSAAGELPRTFTISQERIYKVRKKRVGCKNYCLNELTKIWLIEKHNDKGIAIARFRVAVQFTVGT